MTCFHLQRSDSEDTLGSCTQAKTYNPDFFPSRFMWEKIVLYSVLAVVYQSKGRALHERAQRVKEDWGGQEALFTGVYEHETVHTEKQRSSWEMDTYDEMQMFIGVIWLRLWRGKARLGARDVCWVEGKREMPRGNKVGEFPAKFLLFTRRALFSREHFLFPSEVTKSLWKVID